MNRFLLGTSLGVSLILSAASYVMPTDCALPDFGTFNVAKTEAASKAQVQNILWTHAGDLEAQFGQAQNIGTAGMLHGISNGYVIVGGGANFPDGGPEKGGAKKHYSDIYVLHSENGTLTQVNHTQLDYEISYGASITSDDGIYYIGGSPQDGRGNKIILLKADKNGKIDVTDVASLPFTFSDGTAVLKNRVIYIAAGKQDGKASNKFFAFNLDTKELTQLPDVPGAAGRTQCIAQALGNSIYLFSGGNTTAYTDGWKYDIAAGKWSQVSDVEANGQKISLLGANSVKLNEHELLAIGGFNKSVYDDAVEKLGSLKDEELTSFKNTYFGAMPASFKWNKKILIYNADTDTWRSIGEVPFDAPCGEALLLDGRYIYSINGEIKPGTRSSCMYAGLLR